jgi:hypothetical protein
VTSSLYASCYPLRRRLVATHARMIMTMTRSRRETVVFKHPFRIANSTYVAATTWVAPSALIKSAHVLERIGLAAIGGSCGLFVAEGLMRRGTELSVSGWIVI